VCDEDNSHIELLLEVFEQVDDISLNCNVESCCRLVGDEKLWLAGESNGNHNSLAHTAGKFVRILLYTLCRVRDTDKCEQSFCFLVRISLADLCVEHYLFGNLASDCESWVEGGKSVLEYDGTACAAVLRPFLFGHGEDISAFKEDFTACLDFARRCLDKTHDSLCCDRLAAARLTNDGDSFADAYIEGNTAHRLNFAGIAVERYFKIFDL